MCMKKTFTYLLIFLSSFVFGQISISPKTLTHTLSEESEYLYTLKITNSSATPTTLWWKLVKSPSFPSVWTTQTCDLSLCYADNIDECPPTRGNLIPANTTVTFTIHIDPHNLSGSSKMSIKLFNDKEFKNLVAETDPDGTVIADKTLSTKSTTASGELKIFPNPTDDYFVIKNDHQVARVGIYNIIGKEIRSYKHQSNYYYDVSDLTKGVYIVRLLDNRSKTLKSIRLSIR
jgi:hypothetical protein